MPEKVSGGAASALQVSVIIPAYNTAPTIAETLQALIAQSYPHWEAVVVDDGSTDETVDVTRRFSERETRIRLVRQGNLGEGAARNTGVAAAGYDWLLFLDADDLIEPTHLERMTAALASDPVLDAVHCRSARLASDGTVVIEHYAPPAGDLFPILARRAAFPVHACVVRKRLVEEVGGFDTSLRTSPDWDLWQRIARTGARFGAVPDMLAVYRMRPDSASLNAHQLFDDGVRVLRRGHAPDTRVKRPHPEHASGLPPEQIPSQLFYLLCWCAGLILGRGEDASPLLQHVRDETYSQLDPAAVAQCLYDAAPLPTCQPPSGWDALWPAIHRPVDEFLRALEAHAQAPGLASRATIRLTAMILKRSPAWSAVIEALEQKPEPLEEERAQWRQLVEHHARDSAAQRSALERFEQRLAEVTTQCAHWQQLADEQAARNVAHQASLARLGAQVAGVTAEAARWHELAEARAQALALQQAAYEQLRHAMANLDDHFWVRCGKRLRLIKRSSTEINGM